METGNLYQEVVQYDVIVASSVADLRHQFNVASSEGWEPLGGVSTCYNPSTGSLVFAQAIVRFDDSDDDDEAIAISYDPFLLNRN